jgi:hypothetical protein
MLAKNHGPRSKPRLQKLAKVFRLWGWVSFWSQLLLALTASLVLLFVLFGRHFSADSDLGTGLGISLALFGIVAIGLGAFLAFRHMRLAKVLRESDRPIHPHKAEEIQLLRFGVVVGLCGIFIGLLGAGASGAVLLAKTVSQPPGVALTDPTKIVRALDVFVMLANLNNIAAHFVGATTSIWLLEVIRHPQLLTFTRLKFKFNQQV